MCAHHQCSATQIFAKYSSPLVVGICMVLEQSLVEVCLKGLNGVSMCPLLWEWCMNACEKSVRWYLHVCENMSVRMIM